MTDIAKTLANSDSAPAVQNLAQSFGITPEQAQQVIGSVAPEMSRELERITLSRGGLADLVETMGRASHERFLDDASLLKSPAAQSEGIQILSDLFGTKHKSRVVAARAARQTNLSEEAIKSMLPALAGLFMGQLAKQTRGQIQQ
ncbi:MAG: DUF937 domain-containing protein, partial [Pseudomonadota bacterium]